MDLLKFFENYFKKNINYNKNNIKIYVGYSGGVDSHVLLDILAKLKTKNNSNLNFDLTALHVNHQLHSQADYFATHCQKTCELLDVNYEIIKLNIKINKHDSIEAKARFYRYQAFENILKKNNNLGNYLFLGHHLNDQVETVLLNLLRGSGVGGLAAMPEKKFFTPEKKAGQLIRPFLSIAKKFIVEYAQKNNLVYINDPMNDQPNLRRYFIREKLLPLLLAENSGSLKTIGRVAQHSAAANHLIQEIIINDLQSVLVDQKILVDKLKKFSLARQREIIRYWIKSQDLPVPNSAQLDQIVNNLINSINKKNNKISTVTWHSVNNFNIKISCSLILKDNILFLI